MELERLKQYIRIDTDDDDILLEQLKQSAEQYLKNAGVSVGYENALYCTAVNMLVSNWYDNRDVISAKDTLSMQFKNIVSQLAHIRKEEYNG